MWVFPGLLVIRLLCAQYSIIPDCDEVFNYWEPLHYLLFKSGLQTWEYSPEFAIRSWAYELLHALPLYPLQLSLGVYGLQKRHLFVALRVGFAILSAWAETRLYKAICHKLSRSMGQWYLVFSALSTGMFHASISFLPSSFAMHFMTLAMASHINGNVVSTMTCIAIGGIAGWPFALAMAAPFAISYLAIPFPALLRMVGKTLLNVGILCGAMVLIDSLFYKQLIFVPSNIVLYNVFSEHGPNIFGTEPWWYYALNLGMNFNVALPLALLAILFKRHSAVLPFYLWLAIFTLQPHKEERFMYVLYPALCFNAAASMERIMNWLPWNLDWLAIVGYAVASLSRTLALALYYGAPISVFKHLPNERGDVCIGQEWYRYPSSFFLHDNQRLKFVESGFDGLLPGEFDEQNWPGMHLIPTGMNDLNKEDKGKYTDVNECTFLVDTEYGPEWEPIYCEKFLNNGQSGIGRVVYPGWNLVYDDYCLLKRV